MNRTSSRALPRKRGRKAVRRADTIAIDVLIRSPRWKNLRNAAGIVRKAVRTAAIATSTPRAELAIVLTDDSAIHALNRDWRDHDKPTNVLSFPAARAPAPDKRDVTALGDIVIAYQTTAREARAERKPLANHLAHLAIHGFLHLVGYDHETLREARAMESLEVEILGGLGVPDPYAVRGAKKA
jgi:probable rRNA maturation factor